MTLRHTFEVVEVEMSPISASQSEEIAAIGFDGSRLLVQFHRLPGLYQTPATEEHYENLLLADVISVAFTPSIAGDLSHAPGPQYWHRLSLWVKSRKH